MLICEQKVGLGFNHSALWNENRRSSTRTLCDQFSSDRSASSFLVHFPSSFFPCLNRKSINIPLDILTVALHRLDFLQRSWLEWRNKREAVNGYALSRPWENWGLQVIGRLGWKHIVAFSEASWKVLAASGLSARAIFWRLPGWGERAAWEICRPPRWLPCLFGRRHDHRRSSSHISDHAQHFGWDQGWDWCKPLSLGCLDSGLDRRGE